MLDFFYIVEFKTLIPLIAAGFITGVFLFKRFKLEFNDYYNIAWIQFIFGFVGILTRFLIGTEIIHFTGVIFLWYIFLISAIIGKKLGSR